MCCCSCCAGSPPPPSPCRSSPVLSCPVLPCPVLVLVPSSCPAIQSRPSSRWFKARELRAVDGACNVTCAARKFEPKPQPSSTGVWGVGAWSLLTRDYGHRCACREGSDGDDGDGLGGWMDGVDWGGMGWGGWYRTVLVPSRSRGSGNTVFLYLYSVSCICTVLGAWRLAVAYTPPGGLRVVLKARLSYRPVGSTGIVEIADSPGLPGLLCCRCGKAKEEGRNSLSSTVRSRRASKMQGRLVLGGGVATSRTDARGQGAGMRKGAVPLLSVFSLWHGA